MIKMKSSIVSPQKGYVTGYRFQPIVNLSDEKIVAHEVLSQVRETNPEMFFDSLPAKLHYEHFIRQIYYCSGRNEPCWINIPVAFLIDDNFYEKILSISVESNISLEIQDPANFPVRGCKENIKVIERIRTLQSKGWVIILDDLNSVCQKNILSEEVYFDVIKIDKKELYSEINLERIIKSSKYHCDYIVVEGIENHHHFHIAKQAGADGGQGFLWHETKVAFY